MRSILALLAALVALPVHAAESVYSTLDFESGCRVVDAPPTDDPHQGWAKLMCLGIDDYPVFVSDSDARMSLAYGFAPADRPWTSFQSFNYVHQTIEWRFPTAAAGARPMATIHRWFIDAQSGGRRQVLVVSRVWQPDGNPGCVVGYVDANANRNANVLAREIADRLAPGFKCGKDTPRYHGTVTSRTPRPHP